MKTHYFTFAKYPENPLLHDMAVMIEAETPEIARISMMLHFGHKWQYHLGARPKTKVLKLEEAILLNYKYLESKEVAA